MSRTYATPLELELSPSRQQRRLLLFIHALVVMSVLLLPWPLWLRLLGLVIVLSLSLYQLRITKICKHLVWENGNNWQLTTQFQSIKAELLPESLVTAWLVILLFRLDDGSKTAVLIWSDSIHWNAWRRLHVRMKVESGTLFSANKQ